MELAPYNDNSAIDLPADPIFEDLGMMYASTMAGHGVALCPVELVREGLADGRLLHLFDIPVNEDQGYLNL